jgi:hypothetical protein
MIAPAVDADADAVPLVAPRFLLFAGNTYYPDGGMRDFRSAHATFEEAEVAYEGLLASNDYDWAHVADVLADDGVTVVLGR